MRSTWKQAWKWCFLVNFSFHFFLFCEVEILRKPNTGKFCILKNIVLSVIDLGRELCFLFFHFFISYANLEFRPAPCQWPKIKKAQFFKTIFLLTLAKLGPLAKWMQIFLLNIMSELSQSLLFTYFCIFIYTFFSFWPSLKRKCCLRREAVINSCRTQGESVCSSVHPSIRLSFLPNSPNPSNVAQI